MDRPKTLDRYVAALAAKADAESKMRRLDDEYDACEQALNAAQVEVRASFDALWREFRQAAPTPQEASEEREYWPRRRTR